MWVKTSLLAMLMVGAAATTACADGEPDAATMPQPVSSATARGEADPFAAGSRYWSVTSGASFDASEGWIYLTQLNAKHYVMDNLAIEYGTLLGYANLDGVTSGFLGGPQGGVRWHLLKRERWSAYMEGLVGAVVQEHPLSDDSLHFNFDLQPGIGTTYRISRRIMWDSGFHWHHLSNARIHGKDNNFGYDGPLLYTGVSTSF